MKSSPNTHKAKYEAARRRGDATTVAEYEAANGLPLFALYPEAASARDPHRDVGWFMYSSATSSEERARAEPRDGDVLAAKVRGCTDCGVPLGRMTRRDACPSCSNKRARPRVLICPFDADIGLAFVPTFDVQTERFVAVQRAA